MSTMLTVVGGTYLELCREPHWYELYGSGLRGAAAISNQITDVNFISSIGRDRKLDAEAICATFNIHASFTVAESTVSFSYYHPLSKPFNTHRNDRVKINLPSVSVENILVYGMIEAEAKVTGAYVVYDPQNWIPFKDTGSNAEHLALVLNRKEAYLISGLPEHTNLAIVGKYLLTNQNAEVVVIKNGSQGALVIEPSSVTDIPVFKTSTVWPIGSGDIFSAAFALKWAVERKPAVEAAYLASRFTAHYCQSRILPLPLTPKEFQALIPIKRAKKVYLAGPFFTISERWLVNEIRDKLIEFGNIVFSPLHDVGFGSPATVVGKDLDAIQGCDVVLSVFSGLDPGTVFEIGYAKALGKRVVVLAENVLSEDLTMLIGTDCEITNDFSTAIYQASW